MSATTVREIWSVNCEPAFQASPERIRDPIESLAVIGAPMSRAGDRSLEKGDEVSGERARFRHDRGSRLVSQQRLAERFGRLNERDEAHGVEAPAELELVVVDRLVERLPAWQRRSVAWRSRARP